MTPSQRHYALRAARAWGRWRGTGLGRRSRRPRCPSAPSRRPRAKVREPEPLGARSAPRGTCAPPLLWRRCGRRACASVRPHAPWADVDLESGMVRVTVEQRQDLPVGGSGPGGHRAAVGLAIRGDTRWFCDTRGSSQYREDAAARRHALVGLPPHALRRGHAVHWLRQGGSQASLQVICGWRTSAMVSRYTRALAADLAVEEARRLQRGPRAIRDVLQRLRDGRRAGGPFCRSAGDSSATPARVESRGDQPLGSEPCRSTTCWPRSSWPSK